MTESGRETSATATNGQGFDPGELRPEYREERDKRLRSDGNEQYIEVKGDFAHFLDIPYVATGYYDNETNLSERGAQDGFYGGGSIEFIEILEAWRADGTLPGLEQR